MKITTVSAAVHDAFRPPKEIRAEKAPATCPVCQGRGHHYLGFYLDEMPGAVQTNGPQTTRCRTCLGSGMVRV